MAISHADHDHPNTPAARAACRKQMAKGDTPLTGAPRPTTLAGKLNAVFDPELTALTALAPAKIVKVEPMGRGSGRYKKTGDQGVVKGTKVKAYERPIRTAGDLPADIPAHLVRTIEAAWEAGLPVVEGMRLNDAETRILIGGVVAQVSLVFNGGGSGVFVRSVSSSIARRVDSGPQALALATGDEDWPWMVDGKRV